MMGYGGGGIDPLFLNIGTR